MAELTDTQRLVLAAAVHATTGHPMPKGTDDLSSVHHEVESLVGAFVNEVARHHVTAALDEIETVVAAQRDAFLPSPNLDPSWIAGWHSAVAHVFHAVRGYRLEQDR